MRQPYLMTEIILERIRISQKLIHEKKNIFNCFRRSNNDKQLLDRLKDLQTQLNFSIDKPKGQYYS